MPEAAGMVNVYTCEVCHKQTITINAVEGVTPFMLKCRANWPGTCDGMAQSACYRTPQDQRPNWEWYKPTHQEMDELAKTFVDPNSPLDIRHACHMTCLSAMEDHVSKGGLILRRVTQETLEQFGFPGPRAG